MNDILLKETAKHIDIVDTSLCSFVWRVCNYKQFEGMRGSDFGYLLNLHLQHLTPKNHRTICLAPVQDREDRITLIVNPVLSQIIKGTVITAAIQI